jgi:hypothetical protein
MNPKSDHPSSRPKGRMVFILRLWVHEHEQPEWIAEVQDIQTGTTTHFNGLDGLFDWLKQKTAQAPGMSRKNPDPKDVENPERIFPKG